MHMLNVFKIFVRETLGLDKAFKAAPATVGKGRRRIQKNRHAKRTASSGL